METPHFHPRRSGKPQTTPLVRVELRDLIRNAIGCLTAADHALDRLSALGSVRDIRQPLRKAGAQLVRAIALLGLLLLLSHPARAQVVASDLILKQGEGVTIVWNSGPDSTRYKIELLARFVLPRDSIVLGRVVLARISPNDFTLAPGERQTVRVRLRETSPTETLGFAVTIFPRTPVLVPVKATTGISARMNVVIRFVGLVTLQ